MAPLVRYNLKRMGEIKAIEPTGLLDMVAIVKSVGDTQEVTTKKGNQTFKRDIVLSQNDNNTGGQGYEVRRQTENALSLSAPQSTNPILPSLTAAAANPQVKLTVWGNHAEDMQWYNVIDRPVACKELKVSDFSGRSLGTGFDCQIDFGGIQSLNQIYLKCYLFVTSVPA